MTCFLSFFFNDTATTEIYTLSLHDALPISLENTTAAYVQAYKIQWRSVGLLVSLPSYWRKIDRKSTRLNSSHQIISYAVFCLKKKNTNSHITPKLLIK